MSKRLLFTLGTLLLLSTAATAQDHINPEDRVVDMDSPTFVPMVHIGKAKVGADSIQYVRTSKVYVFPPLEFKNKSQETAYYRLVYNIKKVEKEIWNTYKPRMKKLTFTQGKLLIKLIDRECNSTSYELVQAFLGPVRAGFYQAFAWAFGSSLKKRYEPNGADRLVERIVLQVEAGQL